MGKEFIPYEQALALKELGFDEPCMYIFDKQRNNLMCPIYGLFENEEPNRFLNAPLYQQAFRWLREKYSYYAFLQPTSDLISENYCFKILDQYSGKFYSKSYKTYEEAELECLKKLIEIVKNN